MRRANHLGAVGLAGGRAVACLASALAAVFASAGCAHEKPDMLVGFNELHFIRRCNPPQGHFTLELYTRKDGTIPAAFFHDAIPRTSPRRLRCMSMVATEARVAPIKADSLLPLTLYCDYQALSGSDSKVNCAGGRQWARAEQPFDAAVARDSFYVASWANALDQAWAEFYAGMHAAALEDFQNIVANEPDNASAREGLVAARAAVGPGEVDAADAPIDYRATMPDDSFADTDGGSRPAPREMTETVILPDGEAQERKREPFPPPDAAEPLVPAMHIALSPLSPSSRQLNAEIREPLQADGNDANDSPASASGAVPASLKTKPVPLVSGRAPMPIVFLPGLGGGVRDFRAELDRFGSQRRAIALELPGLGFSDGPRDYSRRALLESLRAALDAMNIDRCVVVATGVSATLAAAFAATYPSRVAGMLLLDPFGDLTLADPDELATTRNDLSGEAYLTNFDTSVHALFDHSRATTRSLVLAEAHMLRKEAAAGYFAFAADEPVAQDLRSLTAPIRIVRSTYDDEPFAVATLMPKLPSLIVRDSSSFLMLDAPNVVNSELEVLIQQAEAQP